MTRRNRTTCLLVAGVAGLLVLAGCGGTEKSGGAPAGTDESHSPPAGWSSSDLGGKLEGSTETIDLISCSSGPFCMILAGPQSVAFDGEGFAAAKEIAAAESYGAVVPIALACSSEHFCMVIGQEYGYFTWDGSRWREGGRVPGEVVSGGIGALSCPADGRCVAIGEDGEQGSASMLSYEGGKWSSSPFDDDGQLLAQVSCASADYCQLLGNDGDVFTFDGKSWSPASHVTVADQQEANDSMASISCATGPICLGAGHLGGAVLLDRGSGFEPLPDAPELLDIAPGACGSATFCLVTPVSSRRFESFDGKSFKSVAQPPGDPEMGYLSCTSDEVCVASVTETDEVLVFRR